MGWREAIAATVGGLGFELVNVERGQRGLLQIFIDRVPGRAYAVAGEFITVEDCEQVTRQLQYVLEVEGLEYSRLEVSSPGLDRPLKSEADYARFSGLAVSLVLKLPFKGRKMWQGVLGAAEGGDWCLVLSEAKAKNGKGRAPKKEDQQAEQVFGFKFEEVREARLVPVVDFKGRNSMGAGPGGGQAGAAPEAAAAPGVDGG